MQHGNNNFIQGTDLSNWRESPYSRWAFQNIRELIPSANIAASNKTQPHPQALKETPDLSDLQGFENTILDSYLADTYTDSLLVLHRGNIVWQWQAEHCDCSRPHIVFSVSKSITAMLAGILVGQGAVELGKPISHYLPETAGSAYADCTLRQLLDMTVSLEFKEEYLNPSGDYFRYRNATAWNPVDQTRHRESLESFLYSMNKGDHDHGQVFSYKSPNSDLLGLLLERASGIRFAELLSKLIWKPMGAQSDGYITIDRAMLARAAGGICITIADLAKFGDLVLNLGTRNGLQIIPEDWIKDTRSGGSTEAWLRGDMAHLLPDGRYRNKWYQVGNRDGCFVALGIHGQWLYLNPATEVVIAKLSSQPEPVDDDLDLNTLRLFAFLSRQFAAA